MGCCGGNRRPPQLVTEGPVRPAVTARTRHAQYFEYVGTTGLTAFGPVTGRRYRFARPGARLPVDDRDAAAMAGVPALRRVPAPE